MDEVYGRDVVPLKLDLFHFLRSDIIKVRQELQAAYNGDADFSADLLPDSNDNAFPHCAYTVNTHAFFHSTHSH